MAFGDWRDHPLLAYFRSKVGAEGAPALTGGTPFDDSGPFDDTGGQRLPSNPPQQPGPAGSHPLLAQYMKYAGQGGTLESQMRQGRGQAPERVGDLFTQTTHGARAGQSHVTFDLGGGQKANVYYDPRTGKRSVFKFRG